MKCVCGSFESGTLSTKSGMETLPAVMVNASRSRSPPSWFGPTLTGTRPPPSPMICRRKIRAGRIVGAGFPTRYTSPLGKAATPNVEDNPRPPASSGWKWTSAPLQRRRPANRSMTTDVADSASGDMLFRPEYLAGNAGCACVATVAWKWRLASSGACGSPALARCATSAQRPSARNPELHIATTSGPLRRIALEFAAVNSCRSNRTPVGYVHGPYDEESGQAPPTGAAHPGTAPRRREGARRVRRVFRCAADTDGRAWRAQQPHRPDHRGPRPRAHRRPRPTAGFGTRRGDAGAARCGAVLLQVGRSHAAR